MVTRIQMVILAGLVLIAGVGGTLLIDSMQDGEPAVASEEHGHAHAAENAEGDSSTYYTCPMHPSVVSETPGACPVCGMDLIKKTKSSTGMDPQELAAIGRVALSPTQRVLANVETVEAGVPGSMNGSMHGSAKGAANEIRAIGVVSYNEEGLASIPSFVDGRIEELLVEETGAVVEEGQPVMRIYSEELIAAQEEYLVSRGSSDGTLAAQTKKRLELLGMSDQEIATLRKTGKALRTVTAFAPNAGTITNLNVRQGQYVQEGTPLYEIADLSGVWIEAEVYENNLSSVREGMNVRVVADAFPGESMQGTVTFIHPVVDPETRTVKVRVELNEAEGAQGQAKLKPGMYTSVFIQNGSGEASSPQVMVPKSAVIRGGKTNSVYVEVDDNVFERRQVKLGASTDEFLEIRSGVKAGETVAYRGGFLLDSEVQLNSFGGSGGAHHGGHEEHGEKDKQGKQAKGSAASEHAGHKELTHADIPAEGKEFDPPIASSAVPEGAWYCDMNDTAHWVQHEKGDGECPICGMHLKQKGITTEGTESTEENNR